MARIKPQMIASLYGTFVFDSTTSNKKLDIMQKLLLKMVYV
ncbi:hypothetical protein BTURTLESOX_2523 [bacterium endosymbiont of Bathymodiolus sp. 5 South]|nr:hypothetical protein BTURTLESOX_2523 [bacterium endosymbiont of Bathymodiolus sp. 5 South]